MMYEILDHIDSPADIKRLDMDGLRRLCTEIRDYMVRCCAVNPGHLGSSLGAVELIVGLHYVYDTPADKLVFDVGHQAYAHKIITGRREAFRGNRTKDGISGFPKRSESEYDAFGTGHSSTSISAALGFAEAARMQGRKEKVVALIGDGALTGGLAFEGLNNAGNSAADLLVILNDNNQSIDSNIGALHESLLRVTTSGKYNRFKTAVWDLVGESKLRDWLQKITKDTKSNLVRKSGGAIFESLGFRYFGPIDGNDIAQVVNTLRRLHSLRGPRILHVHTVKGKGYPAAEADPTTWHAPGRFDPDTGLRFPSNHKADRYQDVFGEVLCELARQDSRVVGITPAMATGCGMTTFAHEMPDRFYDVGIDEEHAVTFSAGLAAGGMRPFCNIYSSFAQRAYDQIIHDVALQDLPVVLCFDRGGLVGEDGATHHGCYDMAAFRSIPNAVITAPRNEKELKDLMYSGLKHEGGPYIIRYPRGCAEGVAWRTEPARLLPDGKGERLVAGEKVAVLAAGPAANRAAEAAALCRQQLGFSPAVYDLRFIKPLDTAILEEAARDFSAVLTVEEGCLAGGLFGAVTEYMSAHDHPVRIHGIGIPDVFVVQDRQDAQRAACGLDADGILREIVTLMKNAEK